MCRPAGWVCLGETRVFVCLSPVSMSCARPCSGWLHPAIFLWCSVFVHSASGCMGDGPSGPVLWHDYCEYYYSLQLSVVSCLQNQSNYPILSIIADRQPFRY